LSASSFFGKHIMLIMYRFCYLKVKGRKAGFIQHCSFKKLIVLLHLT
jgi:hypothetical protein